MKLITKLCFILTVSVYSLPVLAKSSASHVQGCITQQVTINGKVRQVAKKPGAGICLNYQLPEVINPGDMFELKLNYSGHLNGSLKSQLRLPTALAEVKTQQSLKQSIQSMDQGQQSLLRLRANEKGFYYIRLLASINDGQQNKTRAFAIPVNIGNVDPADYLKKNGELKVNDKGVTIMDMKAIQTRR